MKQDEDSNQFATANVLCDAETEGTAGDGEGKLRLARNRFAELISIGRPGLLTGGVLTAMKRDTSRETGE